MSGSLHARYNLHDLELFGSRDGVLAGEFELRALKRLSGLLHSDGGSVRASLRFRQRLGGGLSLELEYETSLHLLCQRCLEPFEHAMSGKAEMAIADSAALLAAPPHAEDLLELEEGRLLPAQVVEDELIMSIPLVPRHLRSEDCGSLARNSALLADRSETASDAADG
jgi:uncharacterized protein